MARPGIDRVFERRLAALINGGEPRILQGGRKGVEKESLRVLPQGTLAYSPHPALLGSALTNEHITTDYSEALIELVTPAFTQSCCSTCSTCTSSSTGTSGMNCCGPRACRAASSAMPTSRWRSTATRTWDA
jgi:hypothetical protein